MRASIVGVVSAALLLLEGCSRVECAGPADCNGHPCCWSANGPDVHGTSCMAAPDACAPSFGIDSFVTRVCVSDADCTAGGVTGDATRCCSASGQSFRACRPTPCS